MASVFFMGLAPNVTKLRSVSNKLLTRRPILVLLSDKKGGNSNSMDCQ